MKRWQILMTLHTTGQPWRSADSLPTFYVNAVNGEHARIVAEQVTNHERRYKTSGTAIAMVDDFTDVVQDTYFSWSDV